MKNWPLYGVLFLIVVGAIAFAELKDRLEDKHHKRILKDGIYRTGIVSKIVDIKDMGLCIRSIYRWRVIIDFEYEGLPYSIKIRVRKKPDCSVGSKVSVCVDKSDPRHSRSSL